jgi:hypothetical protein
VHKFLQLQEGQLVRNLQAVMRLLRQQMSLLASVEAADDLLTPPSAAAAITQIWYSLYNVIKSMNYLL